MTKLDAVQNALREGGVPELVRRTRLWTAGRIYPGDMPEPRRARPPAKVATAPKKPAAPVSTASDVEHAEAFAWFEGRRATYERLADAPYTAHVHEFGLSNEDASIDIFVGGDGNLGWNTIVAEKANAGMRSSQIQVRAFSGAGIDDVPSFIKIDVEGAEHRVITGMVEALAAWPTKPAILCEIGWGVTHPQWEAELAAFGDLIAIGYSVVDLDGQPVDVTTLSATTDVLFLPA